MCRVEERVYVGANGTRQTFEDSFPCHKARRGKLCSNVTRKTTEYHSRPPQVARDDTSSPASYNPPTPTSNGTYLVQQRQPQGVSRRPSTKEKVVKPEIIIEFGSRKDKSKKYPSSSSKGYKRSSLGASSIGSNDIAIDSPGSDPSYPIRTGFPEASVPPSQPPAYTTRPAAPLSHQRHTSSASGSSLTTSSQPPSLYATSEPESPSTRKPARYPPTIVHNPPPGAASGVPPSSPTATRGQGAGPSSPYRTKVHVPKDSTGNVGADGVFPVGYSDFQDFSNSSRASSGKAPAPEITDRDAERARQRKLRAEEDRRRQERADHEMAQAIARDEEARQVRFELGRAEFRAQERAENQYAQNEARRAEEREEARQRKQREQDERVARETRKEKADRLKEEIARKEREVRKAEQADPRRRERRDSRPPTRDPTKRHSRRNSMSQHDIIEQKRLLAETEAQMAREREATEQREREERAAFLREQQQTTQYWDPRGGDRYPVPNEPGFSRRNSVSGRRGSMSSNAPTVGLGRTNSQRRVSVIQPAPPTGLPPINTNVPPNQYSTRPPSSSHQNPPPLLFSPGSGQTYSRPPSARHASYENPFAQPPTRVSNTSQDSNPFAQGQNRPSPPVTTRDPWDARDLRDALPRESAPRSGHNRQSSDSHQNTLHRRGKDVIEQASYRQHERARQASRNMGKVVGFEDDYEDSDSENEEDKVAGYGPRLGLGKHGRKP